MKIFSPLESQLNEKSVHSFDGSSRLLTREDGYMTTELFKCSKNSLDFYYSLN